MTSYLYGHCQNYGESVTGSFKSQEEAVQDAQEYYDDSLFFVGKYEVHEPLVSGDDIIELLQNDVEVEEGEDWLDYLPRCSVDELTELVNMVISHWLKKVDRIPEFGKVISWEEIR